MKDLTSILSIYNNEHNYSELLKQLKNTIPFIGAGVSSSYYPMWKQYLKSQCKLYNISTVDDLFYNNKYEEIAELIFEKVGYTAFYADLKSTFSKRMINNCNLTKTLELLSNIFQETVITTNFDCVLETVYERINNPFEKILFPCYEEQIRKTLTGNRHNLIKLHGDISENSFLVFTKKQYEEVYGEPVDLSKPFPKMLKNYIEGKTLLFIGCSLSNDRITQIMKEICKDTQNISHFAILEQPTKKDFSKRTIELSQMGVLPIYFPRKDYEFIDILLEDILKKNFI